MTDKITAPHVYQAITNVMSTMAKEGIGKDRRNSQQGYNFRGIDDVYNTLCGVLAENNLVILPTVRDMQREERQTQKGGVINYTILTVDFKLVSSLDGTTDTVRMIGEAMDSADKSSNKAQSAALKYACLQVFMIPTEGDNDADATTHDVAPRQAKQEPQRKARPPAPITGSQLDQIKGLIPLQKTKSVVDIMRGYQDKAKELGKPVPKDFDELTEQQGDALIKRLNEIIDQERIAVATGNPQHDAELADEIPY